MRMIKLHNWENSLGKNNFTLKMNEFGDLVSVAWNSSQCVLLEWDLLFYNSLWIFLEDS